ncbi:hypothetical protein [Paludibacterium denitrificans]|uniref:Uncharacterized protein n=1 Tax=Paludibacterium denitrificans TaxID=2675226 RepID=A0A844GA01_9NEIS|nr:hypothetical protein [Paludibacterium denitrificans]MTD32449.1 hypothetical protein [Paludibacterium denitrificans]
MGMHPCWQKVAAEIGMDAFLAMWRILDKEEQWHHIKGSLEIRLRHYSSYEKFQRNLYIKQLSEKGHLSPKEIHYRLCEGLCEKLELAHIKRIINNK